MFYRNLGKSGLKVSAVGMGCWAIGGKQLDGDREIGWGEINDDESIAAIETAIDLGINFFDTADLYGVGHSEVILGKAIKKYRDKVILATKFGYTYDEKERKIDLDLSNDHTIKACEASLKRLKTDYIDLYQLHWGHDPVEIETALRIRECLEGLVKKGKIRYYGWSTDIPENAEIFADGEHCVAIQHSYNILCDYKQILPPEFPFLQYPEIIEICETNNWATICRQPLAMGLLTGKFNKTSQLPKNDVRGQKGPDWMVFFKDGKPNEIFLEAIDLVKELITQDGRSIVQGAIAWTWSRSENAIPIPGFKNINQVKDNAAAAEFGPLSVNVMKEIKSVFSREI